MLLLNRIALCAAVAAVSFAAPYARTTDYYSSDYPKTYSDWAEALVAGNGMSGVMVFGNPLHEQIVVNDRSFNLPGDRPSRTFNTVPADSLAEIRRLCVEGRYREANAMAVRTSNWRDGGDMSRHPGYMIELIAADTASVVSNYSRTSHFSTGEIAVSWEDAAKRRWTRHTFVSRADGVMVTEILVPADTSFTGRIVVSLDDRLGMPEGTRSETSATSQGLEISVDYPHDRGNYHGIVRVAHEGGELLPNNDGSMDVKDVRRLIILSANMPRQLDADSRGMLRSKVAALPMDYKKLLTRHAAIHSDIYNRVSLDLNADPRQRAMSNEELLELQKKSSVMLPALMERLFDAGRYHFLSSSSTITPPDLLGIWTGDCKAGWGGYYHLDSNLNLQVAAGNTLNMPECMEGYFHINEVWAPDFEENARRLLGCRGMVACGNTPGLSSGLMASINEPYPYHYATGEEGWLLYPFWEHYLVTRDEKFLADRLMPLLVKMGEFYEDFLQVKDADGHYIFAGSISPENQPSNLRVSLLANSVFDISGARFCLSKLLWGSRHLGVNSDRVARWQEIYDNLPPYLINEDGAIKEWAVADLHDNYNHRHLSPIMEAWPYHNVLPSDSVMFEASREALRQRDRFNYEEAGHGYLMAALIGAHLGMPESVRNKLYTLMSTDFYYSSLATSHYPRHRVFCTDVANSFPALVTDMLVNSSENDITLLPALARNELPSGKICGLLTRAGVKVNKLQWSPTQVICTLSSPRNAKIKVNYAGSSRTVTLKPHTPVVVSFDNDI